MKTKNLSDKQRLEKAIKALEIYANSDFWQYRYVCNKIKERNNGLDPVYTSLEVNDRNGKIKNGWEWAKEALEEIE